MTPRNQPHKYCCATCKHNNGIEYKHCDLILKDSPKSIQIGVSHAMAIVGCSSHSDAIIAEPHGRLKCPKCNGPVFVANIDGVDTILCSDDTCKWKQKVVAEPAEQRIVDVIKELEKRESEAECGLTLTDYKKIISMLHELALLREKGE